jgi:serine/threonine protein kinase
LYDKIGSGSFGTVYIATWRFTKVAAKVLENSSNEISIVEFRSELQSLSQTRHPNIIQFFGACTLKQPYIILIEYMSRGNLETNNHNLNNYEKKQVLIDICTGLAYLHNRKPRCIIHRDLKPNNILLNLSGRAKIADFGLSKFQQNHSDSFVMTGETGTYRYMAPEVIMHKNYNSSVDIWSFGMIMYFMFFTVPFIDMNTFDIVQTVSNESFNVRFSKVTYLTEIIANCTSWNSNDRPQSIDLIDALEHIQFPVQVKSKCNCFGI